jgi:cyclase
MFRPRVIPILLLKGKVLVKSIAFKDHRYIGDPINAVKIFNDLRADELVFLDISASTEKRLIQFDLLKSIGEEANMPFAVGGGIRTLEDIKKIISAGAEKVVLNSIAAENPNFVKLAADTFGSSSITVCIDVKKKLFGKEETWIMGGKKSTGYIPQQFAELMEKNGAGEIIIQSIAKDGAMTGYDVDLIKRISGSVKIPTIALGGCGSIEHMQTVYGQTYTSGLAAGSMFVFQGSKKGVLITYPDKSEISTISRKIA